MVKHYIQSILYVFTQVSIVIFVKNDIIKYFK
jgi:hypothetical protein